MEGLHTRQTAVTAAGASDLCFYDGAQLSKVRLTGAPITDEIQAVEIWICKWQVTYTTVENR